ncbi:MAG: hypothetical protein OXI24_07810 [Candidatus Poribacteria bacterium]|nr:hypothetical protein [Candidatus Poribacteria bacterium]MDE0554102.1 hypothetical protein [Candidatus Poribacteria bacterium]
MNIVSIYKTLARKPTQTSPAIMLSFLLTAESAGNATQRTFIPLICAAERPDR